MQAASIVLPTRNVAYAMAFDRSFRRSLAPHTSPTPSFFLVVVPLRSSTTKKTATAFGSIDCVLRLHLRFSDTLPASGGRTLRLVSGHKLSLTATLSLTPAPPAMPTVSARFRSAVNPKPPLAIPSRRCRSASLPPSFALMPYCQQRSSHPQRKKPPASKPPARSTLSIVCDAIILRPFGQRGFIAPGASAYSQPTPRCEAPKSMPEQPPAQGKRGSGDSSTNLH